MMPSPKAIGNLSVSSAISLTECEMQLAFKRDEKFQMLNRTSVHAHLGQAIHKVSESFRIDLPANEFEKWFDSVWEQAIAREFSDFQSEIFPSTTRSPKYWPNYSLKRLSLKKALEKRLFSRALEPQPYVRVPLEGVEVNLPIEKSIVGQVKVHGRVDAIRNFHGVPQIVDLKSGDSEDANRKTQLQLALYAYLYFNETGIFPICARQSVNGNFEPFRDLTETEVERRYQAVLVALDAFNQHLAEDQFRYSVTENSCRGCDFRAVCDGFKSSVLNAGNLKVLEGHVKKVSENEFGSCTISVESGEHESSIVVVSNLNPKPWRDALGTKASFTNLTASSGSSDHFKFTEFSRGVCFPST